MEADDGAILHLVHEDMLEAGATDLALAARVLGEPQLLDQVAVRLGIGTDQALLLQELHGLAHHRSGHHGIQEVVLLLALVGSHMLVDQCVVLVVVEQQSHLGYGRRLQGLGVHMEEPVMEEGSWRRCSW